MIKNYDVYINGKMEFRTSNYNSTINSKKALLEQLQKQKSIKVAEPNGFRVVEIKPNDKIQLEDVLNI